MSKLHVEELRQFYINNPPKGMSLNDIKNMSDDDLLDIDYFLHEDDNFFDILDDDDVDGFFNFLILYISFCRACFFVQALFSFLREISYKEPKLQCQWYHNFGSYLVEVTYVHLLRTSNSSFAFTFFGLVSSAFLPKIAPLEQFFNGRLQVLSLS